MQRIIRIFTANFRQNTLFIKLANGFKSPSSAMYSERECKINTAVRHDTHSRFPCYYSKCLGILWASSWAGLLKYLRLTEEEESELVQILKKAEVNIVKKEYAKAEQMLHLALRISQQLQNEKGITWIYSRLANVAFESSLYEKARTLFIEVMRRVIDEGMDPEDLPIIHMSFKLAKIFEYTKNYNDSEMGYQFCLRALQKHLYKENPEYEEAQQLLLLILTGYGYFHYHLARWDAALGLFQQACDISTQFNGEKHEKTILLLNNIGTVYKLRGNMDEALKYFHKAEVLVENIPDWEHYPWVYLNLGYTYMENKMLSKAKFYCNRAFLNSSRQNNESAMKESNKCLLQIKEFLR